ncbi:MAG: YraN family protein [Clostridia bacterium]|nr:YraN family protein [Clostridia bacterium]
MSRRKILGNYGEKLVREELIKRGYKILESNFRTRHGEIDIISKKGNTLVFTEVKTRTSFGFGTPMEAVNHRKQRKVRQIAVEYLSKKSSGGYGEYRFDAAAVLLTPQGQLKELEIYEGVF